MSGHCPCMTLSCHLTTGFPPSCPFHVSHDVLVLSLPCRSTPPLHVPDIFSVCPLHLPCMSRSFVASHFPTSPVVPIGFLVLCFPFLPPALPLFSFLSLACPFQFPFVSLSCPAAFLSCRLPISSPHFLALPCISPLLPNISRKTNTVFPAFSQLVRPKTQSFSRFSAKGGRKPKPAKSRQGESYFATPAPRGPWGGGGHVSDFGRGGGGCLGRVNPLSSRHAEQCRRIYK